MTLAFIWTRTITVDAFVGADWLARLCVVPFNLLVVGAAEIDGARFRHILKV